MTLMPIFLICETVAFLLGIAAGMSLAACIIFRPRRPISTPAAIDAALRGVRVERVS